MVDLYCMYNRARGTDLISPEDLNMACANINIKSERFTLKTYASGVKTIQLKSFNEATYYQKIAECIKQHAKNGKGLTATRIAELMGVNVVLMKEHVKMAEEKGVLCADISYEGTQYFENRFADC
jgi:ESCRT-II complex subunit VPS36